MNATATITVDQRQLLNALKQLQKIEKAGKKKDSTLEVTIFDGYIRLVIPGIDLIVQAFTKGSAKFTLRLWYFTDIVNAEKDKELHFTITENQLKLRGFTFKVLTTFFENDRILRSINLPLNYTDKDLAKLYLSGKYTDEELLFNNLDKETAITIKKVKTDINKIILLMKNYGFKRKEVEELMMKKLKGDE